MAEESTNQAVTMEGIAQSLSPVIQAIEKHITDLHGKHAALEQLVNQHHDTIGGLINGIQGAVDTHKKNAIKEHAMANHGPELDALSGVYSDMHDGRNIHEDLADAMHKSGMGEPGVMEEAMPHVVAAIKSKYGKYKIASPETEVDQEASKTEENPEKKAEVPVEEKVTEVESKPSDIDNLKSTFDTVMGKKK